YFMGTGPLYLAASALLRATRRPRLVGGLAMAWGYTRAWLGGSPRLADPELRRFVRTYQRACRVRGKRAATVRLARRQAAGRPRAGLNRVLPRPPAGPPGRRPTATSWRLGPRARRRCRRLRPGGWRARRGAGARSGRGWRTRPGARPRAGWPGMRRSGRPWRR